jgi:Flp pilus assembly secretin CpaC
MRFCSASFIVAAAIVLAPGASAQTGLRVGIDQTAQMRLPAPAASIAIGNGAIAEVSAHDPSTLLVTGKAFGSTNLLVLGGNGDVLYSGPLLVGDDKPGQLTIVRGDSVNSYSCIGKCRPTPVSGDDPDFFGKVMATIAKAGGGGQ